MFIYKDRSKYSIFVRIGPSGDLVQYSFLNLCAAKLFYCLYYHKYACKI